MAQAHQAMVMAQGPDMAQVLAQLGMAPVQAQLDTAQAVQVHWDTEQVLAQLDMAQVWVRQDTAQVPHTDIQPSQQFLAQAHPLDQPLVVTSSAPLTVDNMFPVQPIKQSRVHPFMYHSHTAYHVHRA
jgi:hypothetical protein